MQTTPHTSHTWTRAVVYGLGISGRSAAALLRRLGVEVVAFDRRTDLGDALGDLGHDSGVHLHLGDEPTTLPAGIDGVVVSPGVPVDRPLLVDARRHGVPIIAEVELAFACLPKDHPVVAITGSNGKSTTTAMAGAMLRAGGLDAEVCGNIGEAMGARVLALLEATPADRRIFVVELSSFQLLDVDTFHAGTAALLNISPDHLDHHASFEEYRDAKLAIFNHHTADDMAILNARDPLLATLDLPSLCRFFDSAGSVGDGCELRGDTVWEVSADGEHALFTVDDMPLPGPHNLENAMAAALLARTHGVEPTAITTALRDFRGLPHRLERVLERRGVVWFDDSKGTNLAATVRSLEGFDDGGIHAILGGRYKGGDLSELVRQVKRKARQTYLIGEAQDVFADALASAGVPFESLGTLDRAVERADALARPGEAVVLSPACSSFDQFPNFAERGRVFQRLVHALDAPEVAHGA